MSRSTCAYFVDTGSVSTSEQSIQNQNNCFKCDTLYVPERCSTIHKRHLFPVVSAIVIMWYCSIIMGLNNWWGYLLPPHTVQEMQSLKNPNILKETASFALFRYCVISVSLHHYTLHIQLQVQYIYSVYIFFDWQSDFGQAINPVVCQCSRSADLLLVAAVVQCLGGAELAALQETSLGLLLLLVVCYQCLSLGCGCLDFYPGTSEATGRERPKHLLHYNL